MEVVKTPIEGVLLIKPQVFGDQRGYFVETWQKERYEAAGINLPFVQDNHSKSTKGILRGLHFQKQHPQGKLVMVSLGEVFDVAVDIRKGSPTFGKWFGAILNQENQNQLWIPPGMAHGFVVLSEEAVFQYKCDNYYAPGSEGGIAWDDPALAIDWRLPAGEILLSEKDRRHPKLADAPELFEYDRP